MNHGIKNIFPGTTAFILFWIAVCFVFPSWAAAANTITGSVRNQSTGQPSVADEVILLRLLDGMQEEARTKTGSQGGFSFNVQFSQGRYLVRVMHQAVNYDREAAAGGDVAINVFDAAPRVKGVGGKIAIMRIGSEGNSLHVSDMYDIKNDSTPPLTQAGERTFEFYLPAKAAISSILAAGPGAGGVKITATPVKKEPGHYTLSFPLRPGETRFAVNYELPYDGHGVLRPRLFYPVQQLAVMLPPSMTFSSHSPGFHPILSDKNYQVQAANNVAAGEVQAFEISGNGAPPPISARARAKTQSQSSLQAQSAAVSKPPVSAIESSNSASAGRRSVLDSKATSTLSRSLPFQAVLGLVLVGGLALLFWSRMRINAATTVAPVINAARRSTGSLEAVKEELFRLEKEKVRGSISREEYATAKQALDQSVQRAMAKAAAQKS